MGAKNRVGHKEQCGKIKRIVVVLRFFFRYRFLCTETLFLDFFSPNTSAPVWGDVRIWNSRILNLLRKTRKWTHFPASYRIITTIRRIRCSLWPFFRDLFFYCDEVIRDRWGAPQLRHGWRRSHCETTKCSLAPKFACVTRGVEIVRERQKMFSWVISFRILKPVLF